MANWNLSVDLRASGNSLGKSLREAARYARSLEASSKAAKRSVRELGQASETASRRIRTLGREARTAAGHLRTMANGAQRAERRLSRYGSAARDANRHLNSLGSNSQQTGRQLARMSGQIDHAIRDLTRLATAAGRASTRMHGIGASGARGLHAYSSGASRLRSQLTDLAALMSGGALVMGFGDMIHQGNELQQAMNAFGATTGATAMQMDRAAATANQLGSDLSIPGATAADAAEAMVELAKAGFRTDQAISATRASLILSSAAQVNAADSAKYLGDMMDQFGMGADQAGRAADTLAATANAASGDITDIYYAMKYAGPVAHGLGVSMQDAAAGVGMLGKAGILGQTAGTTLRGMFANLASPTKQMTEGLDALGIQAWDAQGKFKGLRYVIEGLSHAQHEMTQQDFTAAVKKAFGKPAMSGAIAMAHQGVDSFDALKTAVSDTGAASDIAAAKGKGLAGAMLQLKTQARQTGLTIYQGMAPGLEFLTRGVTKGLSDATPKIEKFFKYLNDSATLFGPDIATEAHSVFSGIGNEVSDLAAPLKELAAGGIADVLHLILTVGHAAVTVLENLAHGVEPVVSAFGDITGEGGAAADAIDVVVTAVDLAATAVEGLSGVLVPIGHVVGGLVTAFGDLPGPIQQLVLAALLARRVTPVMSGLATTVSGRVTGAFRGLSQQMTVQRTLAAGAGQSIGRYGAAFAVLQARVPVVGQMASSFRNATTQSSGFAGSLRGVAAAGGTALKSVGSGLMGALGGPWGLAIAGASVALGLYAQHQQQAAQAVAEHRERVSGLTQALQESNGALTGNVRATMAKQLQDAKVTDTGQNLVDVMRQAGVSLTELTDASLRKGGLDQMEQQLRAVAQRNTEWIQTTEGATQVMNAQGQSAFAAAQGIKGIKGEYESAVRNAKDLASASKGIGDGTSAYDKLKDAVGALADKTADADSRTRALRDALDLLSGGSVSLQAAQARVNEAITQANEAFKDGATKADGWGKALVNANGTLNTTSKNGQALFNTVNDIADASSSATVAAYDFAQSQGQTVGQSVAAATGEMKRSRDAVIDLLGKYNIGAKAAGKIADAMGLIPGKVGILLQTEGVDTTLAELLAVQAELKGMPKAKSVKVDALSEDAQTKLQDLGFTVERLSTREYKISVKNGDAKTKLGDFIAAAGKVPSGKSFTVDAKTQTAITDLEAVQKKVSATRGKSITMRAPSAIAIKQLQDIGFGVQRVPKSKNVTITVPPDGPVSSAAAIQAAIDRLHGKTITNYVVTQHSSGPLKGGYVPQARGGVMDFYADGGMRSAADPGDKPNQHLAQIAAAGTYRVWGESETGGEGYVPFRQSARPRSRAITEEIVRRLGGDPRGIQWNADGNVTDWRYDPTTGSLYSSSDAASAGHKTRKVKTKGGTKDVDYWDEAAFERKLKANAAATRRWNADLAKVADRAGSDVAEALANMGEDGIVLTRKMATGSKKYVDQMAKSLRDLAATAKASLTDYTRQLTNANKTNAKFQADLAKLAGMGYGDLASQLAAQGDEAAQQLAAAAAGNRKKASAANTQARAANNALTSDQVSELVQIIAAISTSKTGIHQVAEKTTLGEDEIIAVANKAKSQIKSSLGGRSARFLADLAAANARRAYAAGGIREGMYATRGGIIRFAEPSTHGEAYIPFAPDRRRGATNVLADVAGRFGLGLTDGASSKVIVIREQGPVIGSLTIPVTKPGATAYDIAAQVARQARKASRGGVAARG